MSTISYQEYGYFFAPHEPGQTHTRTNLHGHPRLEVHLKSQPSFEHFDPEQIELTAKIPSGTAVPYLEEMVLFHPWSGMNTFEFGCGHIFLFDRKGKKIDAFTFGGKAHLHETREVTAVVFESPAPIFEVNPVNPIVDLFVDEVEIQLAMRRAAWLKQSTHTHGYEERLALADPLALYIACLQAIEVRLGQGPTDEREMRLRSAIRGELHGLKEEGLWLGEQIGLVEVL
ncbi:MAG TPA: hypothetical protein PK530_02075 [Anaerolineales bacterium]|nr:hypothetical protein [Anaerolineales bacterium]